MVKNREPKESPACNVRLTRALRAVFIGQEMKNHTYECLDHPDKEMMPAYNYLGLIDYICPICKKQAVLVKRELDIMHYWQNGDNGRTCASLKKLDGNWYKIPRDAYFEIEKESIEKDITPVCDAIGYNKKLGYRILTLKREGFQDLKIRDKNGYWQVLEYTDRYGSERWSKPIDETIFDVEAHIKQYAN